MTSEVRELLEHVAAGLGDRASLRMESADEGEERISLIPRDPAAATVSVEYSTHSDEELWITVDEEGEFGDLDWLRKVIAAAISGRVRLVEGRGRHRLEVEVGPNDVRSSTSYDIRGCLPLPWRRSARTTQYQPYT